MEPGAARDLQRRPGTTKKQYLDELPAAKVPANPEASKDKEPPEIKKYFDVVREGTHTVLKEGKTASKVLTCAWYGCKSLLGCRAAPRSRSS